MGQYGDFRWVTSRALDFVPASLALGLPAGEAGRLVTSNAFDCVGASAAGMRTTWVNHAAAPFDTIGQPPDVTVPALDCLPTALAG